jgi:hypothetical protein
MGSIVRAGIAWVCLLVAGLAWAGPLPGLFSDELDNELYNCTLNVTPPASLNERSSARLVLEAGEGKDYLTATLSRRGLTIEAVKRGRRAAQQQVALELTPAQPCVLTFLRRGSWLGIERDGALIYRGELPRAAGCEAGITTDAGWTVQKAYIQRLDPVDFGDNFMRTADEKGQWTVQGGTWGLQSAWDADSHGNANRFLNITYAQNPFAWIGRGDGKDAALCTAGTPDWEDYTFTTAVRPAPDGAVGILANVTGPRDGVLVRWSPASDRGPRGDTLALYKMVDGELALLTKTRGGYIPGQWYALTLVSDLEGIHVLVDGDERLTQRNIAPWRGGVGLYVEGSNGAVFDDVTVYGRTLHKDLIVENQLSSITERMRNDHNGMQEWSTLASDWTLVQISPGDPTYGKETGYHRLDFYGDHRLLVTVVPRISRGGKLIMALNGKERDLTSGYRAVIETSSNPPKTTYTLFRETKQLEQKTTDLLAPGVEFNFRFLREGNTVRLLQDGEPVFAFTDPTPLTGLRPAYYAEGNLAPARKALVLGHNDLDYLFADAPTDWVTVGTWMPTTRWSCAPHWSFLAGWSRGDAVLWHKKRFTGDHAFEAFVGPKMEYPRERLIYDLKYHDFGISICSDGLNPRSGYTGIYGAPDLTGTPNQRTVLLRNGVEVASTPITVPGRGTAHREWFDLMLKKRGGVIEFWVEGRLAITYTDPTPLAGGVPALWTSDNGISLARARLVFANPPEPRTDARIILDEPWFPEWGNVGKPYTLDFPESWATSGEAVKLTTETRMAPEGETAVPQVDGTRVTVTPAVAGEHWYTVTGVDGALRSEPFHLFGAVFNPALKRDDSRALLLYRFDEGNGRIVHDRSPLGAPLDLTLVADSDPVWIPGQGLSMRTGQVLSSPKAGDKLMALAQKKAATLEFWISTDTIYPPTSWCGCMLAWETGVDNRNFAVGHQSSSLIVAPRYAAINVNDARAVYAAGFRTSLQHYVVTWDGTNTRLYCNGSKLLERTAAWSPETWSKDAPVLLGNQTDSARQYLGTYYLVAVHDRCLSDADVKRHYEAGPSAR